MSLEELSQDPFDVNEFVERLAWRANQNGFEGQSAFDPMILHGAFCQTIHQLTDHVRKLDKKALKLEQECIEDEARHRKKVKDLLRDNQEAFQNFQELDERINYVATKVVHLGDQLESVNVPRARNAEAKFMMKYLNMYFSENEVETDNLFDDPSRLEEAAELVQKLYTIAQELPVGDAKFDRARKRVTEIYNKIENNLLKEFLAAYNQGQLTKMKSMCDLLRNFRRYSDVIDRFIEESQRHAFGKGDIFMEIEKLCLETSLIVTQVFVSPETVMTKFVVNIYNGVLRSHIASKLDAKQQNVELYLTNLSLLYSSTSKLSGTLMDRLRLGSDTTFLAELSKKTLFGSSLSSYIETEFKFLRERASSYLERYYESKKHVKQYFQAGGFSDLRREVQAKININIGPSVDDYSGEALLSQEVAISILQEFKLAYGRCTNLLSSVDLPVQAVLIYNILVQYLCQEFIDYAIELGLYYCPLPESRTPPKLHFLSVVADTSAIMHLFEKQFADSLWPIINGTVCQEECTTTKKHWTDQFEMKLDLGLERTLVAVCGYVKHLLTTEQKRTDFKPETQDGSMMHSGACSKVVDYITTVVSTMKSQLDGKNLEMMLTEFGFRLHKVIYEHMLTFQYNSMGAMLAICDVNEYRTCIKQLGSDEVIQLFDILHALCNLLVVPTDNLREVCVGEPLGILDKTVLSSFIQLRSDFKSAKLSNVLGR